MTGAANNDGPVNDGPLDPVSFLRQLGPINPCPTWLVRPVDSKLVQVECVLQRGHWGLHEINSGRKFGPGVGTMRQLGGPR